MGAQVQSASYLMSVATLLSLFIPTIVTSECAPRPAESRATIADFERVTIGMSEQAVIAVLGAPTQRHVRPHSETIPKGCRGATHEIEFVYFRSRPKDSFIIYLDHDHRVSCKSTTSVEITY